MRFERYIDKNCPTCHGVGEVADSRWLDGELWTSFSTCYCVTYYHDDEMKERLRAIRALAGID